jgi:hypothetical protein
VHRALWTKELEGTGYAQSGLSGRSNESGKSRLQKEEGRFPAQVERRRRFPFLYAVSSGAMFCRRITSIRS